MRRDKVSLHHKGLCGWWLPMQPSASGSGPMSQPPVVWLGPGVAVALRGVPLVGAELLVLPVAIAIALGGPSDLL